MMANKKERALEIIEIWNAHALNKFMDCHTNPFEYSSPIIKRLTGQESGERLTTDEIKKMWGDILKKYPDIKSEIIEILEGVDSVAVYYRSTAKPSTIIDVLQLNEDGKVARLNVLYSA
jgi:hypothetical protein